MIGIALTSYRQATDGGYMTTAYLAQIGTTLGMFLTLCVVLTTAVVLMMRG